MVHHCSVAPFVRCTVQPMLQARSCPLPEAVWVAGAGLAAAVEFQKVLPERARRHPPPTPIRTLGVRYGHLVDILTNSNAATAEPAAFATQLFAAWDRDWRISKREIERRLGMTALLHRRSHPPRCNRRTAWARSGDRCESPAREAPHAGSERLLRALGVVLASQRSTKSTRERRGALAVQQSGRVPSPGSAVGDTGPQVRPTSFM